MIFTIIALLIFTVSFIYCTTRDDANDAAFFFSMIFLLGIIIMVATLVLKFMEASQFTATVSQMRANPQNFTIQDASSINKNLAEIKRWQDTIFTFYRGLDTTLLNLNNFVKI